MKDLSMILTENKTLSKKRLRADFSKEYIASCFPNCEERTGNTDQVFLFGNVFSMIDCTGNRIFNNHIFVGVRSLQSSPLASEDQLLEDFLIS